MKHSPLKKSVSKALSPTNAKQAGQETSDYYRAVLKVAGAAIDAAWVSLGGCPSQITAVRVYLALMACGGR
ncbi:hypothetical protein ROG8370_03865 [Roseovarius gaetbuli]|uniref:Uncharacterized protein n=1 Tax=Roseovarius gaetbuli TaxID=1356575 RepID=A0A1X7AD78_9RHOB|nr:hypothetical protein ROG8370_03865 [Roseovarius gaetbuli]